MIDVDDEVADLEIAQVGEERLGEVAALLGRAAFFLEDVGLGVDLQRRIGEPEAARQRADGHEHRGRMRVLGALDGNGDDLVLLQDLDGALGAAVTVGDEQHRVAALAGLPDVGDPVVDAPAELHRRLARTHVPRTSASIADGQLFEPRRRCRSRALDVVPRRRTPASGGAARTTWPRGGGIAVAAPRAAPRTLRACSSTCSCSETSSWTPRAAPRNSITGIDVRARRRTAPGPERSRIWSVGARRSLRGRVEPAQRLDHVADELDAHRLGVAGREDVDDAAANR